MSAFHRDFSEGDSFTVAAGTTVTVVGRKGRRIRLTINSDQPVSVQSAQKCPSSGDSQDGTHLDRGKRPQSN